MRKVGLEIESLSAHRVVDKLAQAGIVILAAERTRKNAVTLWVNGKDRKKVFAILESSCYNVVKVRYRGLERVKRECLKSIGMIAGAFLFLFSVCFMQSRVLRIEIVGSGAYYEREVKEILVDGGTKLFSAAPKDDSALTARILALPRVSFCSLGMEGGVLTVTVEVSDENAVLEGKPLAAPASGTVEELVVVRGTPLVSVGDSVRAGDVLVDCYAPVGEDGTRGVLVIARVKIGFAVSKEYAVADEAAALSQAYLDFGELSGVKTEKTATGWLVEGKGTAEASVNLD